MPNWCGNYVNITGPEDILSFLVDAFHDGRLLASIVPEPDPRPENFDWYNWRIQNWGTKWDVSPKSGRIILHDKGQLIMRFDTAWTPPTDALFALHKKYPKVSYTIYYCDLDMDDHGAEQDGYELSLQNTKKIESLIDVVNAYGGVFR
ncbi:MAG: hypothetical protein SVK08_02070 [Halobacteriota archaeon]|nr:hypothetical protein [Halobacteriota archaeon]